MHELFNSMSKDMYHSLISNNPDAIFLLDKQGMMLDCNSAFVDLFGYSLKECEKLSIKNILLPQSEVDVKRLFVKTLRGESRSYPISVYQKGGHILHLQVKNFPMWHNKQIAGVMIIARDISELLQNKNELQETSERLRALFESTVDAIDIIDLNGRVISVNASFERMYGWRAEEIVGKPIPTIPKHLLTEARERRNKVKAGVSVNEVEITSLRKDGSTLDASLTLSPLYDKYGNVIAISGITRDITERKKLEVELRESKDRYKNILDVSPEPIYVQSQGVLRYINDAAVEIFGFHNSTELLGRHVLDFVHPDSLEIASDVIKRSNQVNNFPKEVLEQKMLRSNLSPFIAEVTFHGIEYDGEPAIQVVFRDISEKKTVENALIRSEEKYRLIADNMTDMVAIIDEDGLLKYASPSSSTILGYTSEDMDSKTVFDFVYKEDLAEVLNTFKHIFSTKETRVMEIRVKHKEKKWIWIETKGSLFIDEEHGKPFILLIAYSIGKRKALQERLNYLAYHDDLTGLPNRRLFQEKMEQTLFEAKRDYRTFALLYMDIDKFKWVNDQLGHSTGDALLVQFGERVRKCLRESDSLARQGGDEFTVLLPNIESVDDARTCALRIIESLQEEWKIGDHFFKTTSSIGIAIYPTHGRNIDKLMTNADLALYQAKESGRNTYRTFNSKSDR